MEISLVARLKRRVAKRKTMSKKQMASVTLPFGLEAVLAPKPKKRAFAARKKEKTESQDEEDCIDEGSSDDSSSSSSSDDSSDDSSSAGGDAQGGGGGCGNGGFEEPPDDSGAADVDLVPEAYAELDAIDEEPGPPGVAPSRSSGSGDPIPAQPPPLPPPIAGPPSSDVPGNSYFQSMIGAFDVSRAPSKKAKCAGCFSQILKGGCSWHTPTREEGQRQWRAAHCPWLQLPQVLEPSHSLAKKSNQGEVDVGSARVESQVKNGLAPRLSAFAGSL
jgi:hypothetical protein